MSSKQFSISQNKVTHSFKLGRHTVEMTTNFLAKLADSCVTVTIGDTTVSAFLVFDHNSDNTNSFLPMRVDFLTRAYAAGQFPGGYFKREGRPTEQEILKSRIIDRTLRPTFPKGFSQEVQLTLYVLSHDPDVPNEIAGMIAASAAAKLSGLPLTGTVAAVKVGQDENKTFILNPSVEQLQTSLLDLHVSVSDKEVVMVECQSDELSEETILDALDYAKLHTATIVDNINEFCEIAQPKNWTWQEPTDITSTPLYQTIVSQDRNTIYQSTQHTTKKARQAAQSQMMKTLLKKYANDETDSTDSVKECIQHIVYQCIREDILTNQKRVDERSTETVRDIDIVLGPETGGKRTHGSAIFQRGETQVLAITTIAPEKHAQVTETLDGNITSRLMLHYNFPPFCVNETGPMIGPKRREIGHGNLAKRSIEAVMPSEKEFPYAIRLVSEVLESNGSSSMATICGSCLSLMDAGVPIKKPVAGIAMGLVKSDEKYQILSDILGDEDHVGDMDFKVAGPRDGITGLQMDIKTDNITREILSKALAQAKAGRLGILDKMDQSISESRPTLSDYAPRISTINVNPDKIRNIIGKGGVTIRELTETYNVDIDISDDGTVKVSSNDKDQSDQAISAIQDIACELETGKCYPGSVSRLLDFGAVIAFKNGETGFLHISEISENRVNDINEHLTENQEVYVKIIGQDNKGRLKVSTKQIPNQTVN